VAAIVVLAVGVSANTLGIDFGVGGEVKLALAQPLPETEQAPDRIVVFSKTGFLVSAPSRDGDVPGLLDALAREGVKTVTWGYEQTALPDFSSAGLIPLAQIAGLAPELTEHPVLSPSPSAATLVHEAPSALGAPPCTRLSDGTGVWVVRYDAAARKPAFYCPTRRSRYYDVGLGRS
jgi:hypothetical protein